MVQAAWTREHAVRIAAGAALLAFSVLWLVIDPLEAMIGLALAVAVAIWDRSQHNRSRPRVPLEHAPAPEPAPLSPIAVRAA